MRERERQSATLMQRAGTPRLNNSNKSATMPPGTLSRERRPSAVWQGVCSLLRDQPTPLAAPTCVHRPFSRGSRGGHGASLGLSKASKTVPKAIQAAKIALYASKTAQNCSKRTQDCFMTAPNGLKRAQRGPQEASRGPKRQQPMVFHRFFIDFWILTFPGFRQLKTAQEASKIAPREP